MYQTENEKPFKSVQLRKLEVCSSIIYLKHDKRNEYSSLKR